MTAKSSVDKDINYRAWNADHSGVYVPITSKTLPNPHLSHLKHRDLTTTDGQKLTLINPAYMTRQAHLIGEQQLGIKAHITSLNPIRHENAADEWETKALRMFNDGAPNHHEITFEDGERELRFMRPLITQKSCLQCHAQQGYKVGDIRGGLSASISFEPYDQLFRKHLIESFLSFGTILLVGIIGITATFKSLKRKIETQRMLESELLSKTARFERMESLSLLSDGLAHDLNNILGPVAILPEVIEEDVDELSPEPNPLKEQIKESLALIITSANRADSVISDLKTLSKNGYRNKIAIDINRLPCIIKNYVHVNKIRQRHPGVDVKYNIFDKPLMVMSFENHLCKVIHHLLRNAADSIENSGVVTISTFRKELNKKHVGFATVPPGNYAIIEVSDTGKGISKENQNRIFEPFFSEKKKSNHEGNGLGLSVVHGIVVSHNGFIDLESKIGSGTTFTIYLPLTNDSQTAPAKIKQDTALQSIERGRVLVVDDDPGQRYLVKLSMTRLGYTVNEANNGHDAIDILKAEQQMDTENPFELLILDMMMGEGMDGLTTLREITKISPKQKVLICSGLSDSKQTSAAELLGADWLQKPFNSEQLAFAVRKRLERS